jgi:hypothetical protein
VIMSLELAAISVLSLCCHRLPVISRTGNHHPRDRRLPRLGTIPGFIGGSGSGFGAGGSSLARIAFSGSWRVGERIILERMPQVSGERASLVIGQVERHNGVNMAILTGDGA